ncbi:Ppx/GppA phosphatase family protein [Actinacidiphila acidipaludis]|uniref:Ppx/GppA phosphatase N-terminal domain-containing protein n=1 Tax=Actinacidiphila acidipaludis TaxID=2873382 RepID=A0ABS7Q0Z8_9ACTN|nr:hypothetical protein [Streptomyces acidipaludis]MBY8876120.1 hypothetical protein [Streptomyces acidipaludis]
MRQAEVLDVGCHSALLSVARGRKTGGLRPVRSRKVRLALHRALAADGRLRRTGIRSVQQAVAETLAEEPRSGLEDLFPFATSVIRDAPNRDEVIDRVAQATGIRLRVLPGEEEARLAYVAARSWAGDDAGPLLVLDIGGGTVEIAYGTGASPRKVYSLPLGARQVTRELLPGGLAGSARHLAEVREELSRSLSAAGDLVPGDAPGLRVLACSKTFTQLARLAAVRPRPGARQLTLPALRKTIPVLAAAGVADRARLPGVSAHRAEQSLAGALVAEALMEACATDAVTICPWSTREGLLIERLRTTAAREPHAA